VTAARPDYALLLEPRRKSRLFAWGLGISTALHALLFGWGYSARKAIPPPVELDLTMSGHVGSPGPRPAAPAKAPAAPPAPKPAEKQWVRPAPGQTAPVQTPEKREPEQAPQQPETGAPSATGEYGEGNGGFAGLTRLPQLLNLGDLRAILKRFYPPDALDRRQEATVVIDLHVDVEGRVVSAEIVRHATPDFDEAARRAALLLRFSPAYKGPHKVPVKLRQAIEFKLER
jgi:TonB family protein